jgi:hypothetical protein
MSVVELEPVAVRPHRRLRTWTAQSLRDVAYCAAVFGWSIAGFTILVTGLAVTASLLVFVVGVLVWIGFVYVARATTWVDRTLAGWQRHERLPARYRRAGEPGVIPFTRTLTTDPQTWRDLTWLAVTSILGFAAGLVVVTAAALALTYISMPLWFWALSHPHVEYGVTNLGFLTVDTLGEALTTTLIGLVLVPVVLVLGRWCASAHAHLAVLLLGPAGERSGRI